LQEPYLFDGTIAQNISFGKQDASFDDIERSAKIAHCQEFILKMDKKYETIIGERGTKLSVGQKQRIAFARALLTMLGIVMGIASVITMMEIGSGSSAAIQKSIADMGSDIIVVFPEVATTHGITSGNVKTLTPQDCDAIKKECPSVLNAVPIVYARTQIVYGNKNWVPLSMFGTTPDFFEVGNENISDGEPFTDNDVLNANKVCMVGQTIVNELFDNNSPVGKEIRIMNVPFRITGVLKAKGANMMGTDQDDIIIAPWTSIKYRVSNSTLSNTNQSNVTTNNTATTAIKSRELYPGTGTNFYPVQSDIQTANHLLYARFANIDQIVLSAKSTEEIESAIQEIIKLLLSRHHININSESSDDFIIKSLTELTETLFSTTRTMTNLLLYIAMISLIVGGVGIMNIMLVCVSERTKEIGLRMAVGARQCDILRQFLTESVLLCMTGGIIGIIIGHGVSLIVAETLKWPIAVSPAAIILAVAVSVTAGIVFGYYPAWKASRLDPIEALRYE